MKAYNHKMARYIPRHLASCPSFRLEVGFKFELCVQAKTPTTIVVSLGDMYFTQARAEKEAIRSIRVSINLLILGIFLGMCHVPLPSRL